ncbi:MAG: hypothetical protein PWP60_746 [Candidatus Atribacteria bacterium]|jgi:uncharacterized membrane protein|uniref:QueT transporter family protein n=1 Tax=Thermatribacter velox TaxID=3039681 RepID=A0ABZ2Y8F7_9BACT|nr:hypothetical protein [Candidatus Atribacteria bacterium]MDI3530897.1 hypothetical protein [Candidatus Atribacteria bacterium]
MKKLIRAAFICAIYVVLTVLPPFYTLSYGPIQVRVAEALTVLPFIYPEAIWGLTLGCLLANLAGNIGIYDVIFGSLLTLLAGYLTSRAPRAWLAPLPPIFLNAFGVSAYLAFILKVPYWYSVAYIMLGESIACLAIGYPVLHFLMKRNRSHFSK